MRDLIHERTSVIDLQNDIDQDRIDEKTGLSDEQSEDEEDDDDEEELPNIQYLHLIFKF